MAKDRTLSVTRALLAEIESLIAKIKAAEVDEARHQAAIAARKAATEEHYSNILGTPWRWGDPSPGTDECDEWLAERIPGWVRQWWKPGDPARSIIRHPRTGQAVSIPDNWLPFFDEWVTAGEPSNAPAPNESND